MPIAARALREGARVRFTATGNSMRPFLHDGDIVELVPLDRSGPDVGQIVLVSRDESSYVLHRVVRILGDRIFLAGDAHGYWKEPFSRESLLGRVVALQRGQRVIRVDETKWRLLGLVWIKAAPAGQFLLELADRLRSAMSSIKRRSMGVQR
jgi:signal peptidase I